jgi:hypothetical protein
MVCPMPQTFVRNEIQHFRLSSFLIDYLVNIPFNPIAYMVTGPRVSRDSPPLYSYHIYDASLLIVFNPCACGSPLESPIQAQSMLYRDSVNV